MTMNNKALRILIKEIILSEYGQVTVTKGPKRSPSIGSRIRSYFFDADESEEDEEILDEVEQD
jgi:hypothetical protein